MQPNQLPVVLDSSLHDIHCVKPIVMQPYNSVCSCLTVEASVVDACDTEL